MKTAVIFDCEFLCIRGSQSRFWCAAIDPDPVIAQIGAVKIGLEDEFPILESFNAYVVPHDRHGARYELDPYFTELTGITEDQISNEGIPLRAALDDLDRFSDGATFWSWGKDELNIAGNQLLHRGHPNTDSGDAVRQCRQASPCRRYAC